MHKPAAIIAIFGFIGNFVMLQYRFQKREKEQQQTLENLVQVSGNHECITQNKAELGKLMKDQTSLRELNRLCDSEFFKCARKDNIVISSLMPRAGFPFLLVFSPNTR